MQNGQHAVRGQGTPARPCGDTGAEGKSGEVTIHGHELSPTNYAACQADLIAKNGLQGTVYYGDSLRRYCALA